MKRKVNPVVKKLTSLRTVPAIAILVAFGGISGCAKDAQRLVQPGETSSQQLVEQLGPALVTGISPSRPAAEQRTYSECEYQVESGIVAARFCQPLSHERTLQYWRQLWREKETEYTALSESEGPHGPDRYLFRWRGGNRAVIFSVNRGEVIQVIDYSAAKAGGN